MTIDIASSRFQ